MISFLTFFPTVTFSHSIHPYFSFLPPMPSADSVHGGWRLSDQKVALELEKNSVKSSGLTVAEFESLERDTAMPSASRKCRNNSRTEFKSSSSPLTTLRNVDLKRLYTMRTK